jgi:hypothetical protein
MIGSVITDTATVSSSTQGSGAAPVIVHSTPGPPAGVGRGLR